MEASLPMKLVSGMLAGLSLWGLLLSAGCGKSEPGEPTRFNRVLGDTTPAAPTAAPPSDVSVLQDPKAYQPAGYEPLESMAGATVGGATAGAQAAAALAAVQDLLAAGFEFDIERILDAFVPEQVASLRQDDYLSTWYETKDTWAQYWAVFKEKARGPELEGYIRLAEGLAGLAAPLSKTISVTVLDEQNAVATIDLGKLELPPDFKDQLAANLNAFGELLAGGAGGMPGLPAAGPGPGGGAAPASPTDLSPEKLTELLAGVQLPLPLRKVADQWKVSLPAAITEEQAEVIQQGLLLIRDMLADLTERLDQVETLDLQSYMQLSMQVQMANMGALMGFVARAQAVFGGPAAPEAPTEAEQEEPGEPNQAQPEPNAPQGGGPARRGP